MEDHCAAAHPLPTVDVLIPDIHNGLVHFQPHPDTCCRISENSDRLLAVARLEQKQIDRSRKEQVRHRIHECFSCKGAHERIYFSWPIAIWIMVEKVIRTLRVPSYGSVDGQTQKDKGNFVMGGVHSLSTRLSSFNIRRFAALFIPGSNRTQTREIRPLTCRRCQTRPLHVRRQAKCRNGPFSR